MANETKNACEQGIEKYKTDLMCDFKIKILHILFTISLVIFNSLLSGCASFEPSSRTVVGVGVGGSIEMAKREALKNAVESVYGSYFISQRLIVDDVLKEEDFSYSSGIVLDYKITSQQKDNQSGFIKVEAEVKVSDAKIRSRVEILSEAKAGKFSGNSLALKIDAAEREAIIQSESIRLRSLEASKMVAHFGAQFPLMDARTGNVQVFERNALAHSVSVDVNVRLNIEYLKNLCRAIKQFTDASNQPNSEITKQPIGVRTLNWVACFPGTFAIPKYVSDQMRSAFLKSGLCLDLFNKTGNRIHSQWYSDFQTMKPEISKTKQTFMEIQRLGRTRGAMYTADYWNNMRMSDLELARHNTLPVLIYGEKIVLTTQDADYSLSLDVVPLYLIKQTESIKARLVESKQCSNNFRNN
jgi:hypothetical protein